jgi:hypothetical protein
LRFPKEALDVKSHRVAGLAGTAAVLFLLAPLLMPAAEAQVNPVPKLPGKPYPPTPRLADGTPNLGPIEPNKGTWNLAQFQDYAKVLQHPKEIPYQPWAKKLALDRRKDQSYWDPQGYCMPPSGPRLMTTPFPMEIIQLPQQKRIVMIYEGGTHIWRIIYMDGRPHPDGDQLNPSWLGHSVGHWEGDTLVVDVVGFNEGGWIDMAGDPHTDRLHVIERYTRKDLYTLHYEATIDDPGTYTEPWTIGFDILWDDKGEIQEYICQENSIWMRRMLNEIRDPEVKPR